MGMKITVKGFSAALSVKRGIQPRKLDAEEIIEALIKQKFDKLKH